MKKTIENIEQSIYKGTVSYSIKFTDGVNGLLTNSTLVKELGGNLPDTWANGKEVDADVEEVTNAAKGTKWNSIKPAQAGGSAPASTGSSYSGGYKGDDQFSKMINTAMMSAASIVGEKPDVAKEVVVELFNTLLNAMVEAYKRIKV